MSGKILYIAYHYPPITVSSGVHRTLAFTRYLVDWGWDVSVLTADYRIYPQFDLAQLSKIPRAVSVIRAWGKDTARDLSFRGRYSKLMALPDRYQSWVIGAVLSGLQQIRRNRPDVIVSTYPIASAHVVGYLLHKITGIPWIADFRDPMAQEGYPEDPLTHRVFSWIEKKAVEHARYLIFTTEGAKTYYEQRYAGKMPYADQMQLIENGYDETVFARMQSSLSGKNNRTAAQKLTLVHSGVVYPSERNPEKLFQALQALKSEGTVTADNFALTLRATGHDDLISGMLTQYGITDLVSLAPSIPYEDALQEMSEVDVLLLLQANNCNDQIPAKAYEYIRIGKPVLALADPVGETGRLMGRFPSAEVAPLENMQDVKSAISAMINDYGSREPVSYDLAKLYSREEGANKLVKLIGSIFQSAKH